MRRKIDNAWRIVVPKGLRERFGLLADMDPEILETPDGILIRRAERKPLLVREGLLLVHTGELPAGYDMMRAVEDDREARIRTPRRCGGSAERRV